MILREYLFVDSKAVRGIIAQIESGTPEAEVRLDVSRKKSGAGVKGFAEHVQEWGGDVSESKSISDALFPRLEDALEAEGFLEDVSANLMSPAYWKNISANLPPGKIVRISLPGILTDSRFVASLLSGFATTMRGLDNLQKTDSSQASPAPTASSSKRGKGGANGSKGYRDLPAAEGHLEDRIPLGRLAVGSNEEMSGEFLRSVIQVMRGMFSPGLHMALLPEAEGSGAIMARLPEGHDYLTGDPEVLFARYGVGLQTWTIVGTVGHHSMETPDLSIHDFQESQGVNRAKFAKYVGGLGTMLGNLGFTDLAQAPGFSVVPWAAYRTIGSIDTPVNK